MQSRSTPMPPELAQAPIKTIRPRDASGIYAHPRAQLVRLSERGLLHRVADGYYIVVPQDMVGRHWTPSLEATAAGIASAIYGPDDIVVMGLHGAVPRALATSTIAVPRQHREIELSDRPAVVRFITRDTARLDAERVETPLATGVGDDTRTNGPRPRSSPTIGRRRSRHSVRGSGALRAQRPTTHRRTRLRPTADGVAAAFGDLGLTMDPDERDSLAAQFGVSTEQVERDHLISHVPGFLSARVGGQVPFIGGTALARTHLPEGLLSEDVDLVALGDRRPVAAALDDALPARLLARMVGSLWNRR